MAPGLIAMLRCPFCASRQKPGLLSSNDGDRLVCQDPDCGRGYPVVVGLPIMVTGDGDFLGYQWDLSGNTGS